MNIKHNILAFVALVVGVCAYAQGPSGKALPEKLVDFEAVQPDGSIVRLSDYVGKGRYVLVDFWASWCGPCREEVPNIKELWYEYGGERFTVVGCACFDKPANTLAAVRELKIPWPQILNIPASAPQAYGFDYIPYIMLFDPDGRILSRDLRGDDLRAAVKKVLSL